MQNQCGTAVLVMCLPFMLNVAEVALGQWCPPEGPGAARWASGMCAMLRKASSSHPAWQRLLNSPNGAGFGQESGTCSHMLQVGFSLLCLLA